VEKLLSEYATEGDYDKNFDEFDDKTCCICLDEFALKQPIIKVKKCGHIFHNKCLRSWLTSSRTLLIKDPRCPLCNLSIKDE
jgi:E3 ubiquitin-protein ligase ATL7/58/59